METEKLYKFAFSNTCMCDISDCDDYCYGDCWESAVEDFKIITERLFENNETMWWKVSNLALWDGNHSGYGYAKTPEDLIRLMTVKSEWNIEGTVFNDRIEYSLSHHDAMGSNTVLTMITDEQREELGLY